MFAQTKIFKTPTMKNGKLLLALFATAAIFSSCGSDDDSGSTSASIVGKWAYSKTGFSVGGQEQLENYTHTTGCNKDYIQFLSDGKFYDVEYPTGCRPDTISSGTYVKNGNTVTFTEDGESDAVTVQKLTNSELKFASSYTEQGVTFNGVSLFTKE